MDIPNILIDELDKIAKNEGFLSYKIEQAPGSKHGDGFVAKMLAITLIGKRKVGDEITDSKLNLMCKMLPDNLDRRKVFDSSMVFKHEIYVYNNILNVFDQFQCEKNIAIEDRFTEYPKCYATASDLENGEHFIIMENLKSIGYNLRDKTRQVDFETACLYMKAIGKFHALSFALRDQKPEMFDEISSFDEVFTKLMQKDDSFEVMIDAGLDKGISLLDQLDEIKVLQDIRRKLKDLYLCLLKKESAGKFFVLGHGDSWNNNLFYTSEESSKVRKIRVLDWQVCRCASPALDISYYLMSSTNKNVRERYDDLLKVYHNSLSGLMRKLGSDPNKWFTLADLIDQLKSLGKFGIMMAPFLLQIIVSEPKNIIDMDAITKDTKDITGLATLDESTTNIFKELLSDVIKDAIRFEWV